jgi:hypothetical protein
MSSDQHHCIRSARRDADVIFASGWPLIQESHIPRVWLRGNALRAGLCRFARRCSSNRAAAGTKLRSRSSDPCPEPGGAQKAEMDQFLADLQNPHSSSYHKWLTPDEVGRRFGASDAQIAYS